MLDFLSNSAPLIGMYLVIRWIFRDYSNFNLKTLGVYSVVALFWFGGSFYGALTIGIVYFLYAALLPFLLPIGIHLLIYFRPNWKGRSFASEPKWKVGKEHSHLIAFTKKIKIIHLGLLGLSAVGLCLFFLFSDLQGSGWLLLVSLLAIVGFSGFSFLQIANVKTQKIILLTGKSNLHVFEKTIPMETLQIDYDKMMNSETSFVDYVGLATVKHLDSLTQEWHHVFKTPDEKYRNPEFVPGTDLYYRDINERFTHVYHARIRLSVANGKIQKMTKNK